MAILERPSSGGALGRRLGAPGLGVVAVALVAVAAGDDAEARLLGWFARNAPAYMKPARIEWREALPIGATGKVDRAALAREFS